MRRKRLSYVFAVLSLGISLFIFRNSLQDATTSSAWSGQLVAALKPILDPINLLSTREFHTLIRKCAHFTEFALLGLSLGIFAGCVNWRRLLWRVWMPVLTALAVAAFDENLQRFVPGRHGSPWDVCIDLGGAMAGILLARLLCRLAGRKQR